MTLAPQEGRDEQPQGRGKFPVQATVHLDYELSLHTIHFYLIIQYIKAIIILYGTFQDQGTTCVSRQYDANFFISKRAEALIFFAPLRMMAGPINHAKKTA